MRTLLLSTGCLVAFGCAAGAHVPRAEVVPPLPISAPQVDAARDHGPRTEADRSPPTTSARPDYPATPSVGESSQPVYRTVVHTVEVPVEVESQAAVAAPSGDGWRVSAYPYYGAYSGGYCSYDPYYGGYYGPRRNRGSTFPINTAVGAGIGAIVGNQRWRHGAGRGALIGGGIGLLFDLHRWLR